ncbi:MAG: SCO family protein [Desulfopila sp.]|jgi:protein SCO1/2|nr:SCO family protein [Desulfopila sp.]
MGKGRLHLLLIFILGAGLVFTGAAAGEESSTVAADSLQAGDPQLDLLWVEEKNGEFLPLETIFQDETGRSVTLAELIDRPTILLPVYFYCPGSCSLNLANLATSISRSRLKPGKDFGVIAFSFDEKENADNARVAKRNYLRLLPDDFPEEKWKFLTGSKESIDAVTGAIGYSFKPQDDGTFIHPSALAVIAADGMIIKYVHGKFSTGDVDMAVSEARSGTPAMSVKRFLDYCFNYVPLKTRSFFQTVKISVLFGFAVMGILFILYVRRSRKNNSRSSDEHQ